MKKITGYREHKTVKFQSKAIRKWSEQMILLVSDALANNQPIDVALFMANTFTPEIASEFSKSELVILLETSADISTSILYSKIASELMFRYTENEVNLKHFLSKQNTETLDLALDFLIEAARFETACFVRDEQKNRK